MDWLVEVSATNSYMYTQSVSQELSPLPAHKSMHSKKRPDGSPSFPGII